MATHRALWKNWEKSSRIIVPTISLWLVLLCFDCSVSSQVTLKWNSFVWQLAWTVALSFIYHDLLGFVYDKQVKRKFGHHVEAFFAILTAIQFHVLFYSTRPLPNIFALALGEHINFYCFYMEIPSIYLGDCSIHATHMCFLFCS
jgi:hypothetical protein